MKIEVYSPTIRRKEMDAVLTAMVEEKIGPGERSKLLLQTIKEQLAFDYALALRSPAVALSLALKAVINNIHKAGNQVSCNQAVVISALSPFYYFQVLQDLHLTPLYCDVTYDIPCMNRELIENAIAGKPENTNVCAIVLHHTLGFIPDVSSIAELGIPVIEDISQSYGGWFKPKDKNEENEKIESVNVQNLINNSGSGSNSNYNFKFNSLFYILGLEERDMLTSGGGAILFAMNKKDSLLLRSLGGISNEPYKAKYPGIASEYCLPDINAALAIIQFKEIQRNIERRRDIAGIYYQSSLSLATRTKHKRFISGNENEYNNYSFSLILETGLKDVVFYARKKEIEIEIAFENTIAASGIDIGSSCPVSNSLVLRTVLFPLYPRLRSPEVERISRLIMTLP